MPNSLGILELSRDKRAQLLETLFSQTETPAYIYNEATIRSQVSKFQNAFGSTLIHFATFCNSNPWLLKILKESGCGAVASNLAELALVETVGFQPEKIVVTGAAFTKKELSVFLAKGLFVNLESFEQLKLAAQIAPGARVGVRLNVLPCEARNNLRPLNSCVGSQTRIGIWESELPLFLKTASEHGIHVVGIHVYTGTNQLDDSLFREVLDHLIAMTIRYPTIERLNLGGGFGISYNSSMADFPLEAFAAYFNDRTFPLRITTSPSAYFFKQLEFSFELGRALIASSGTLIARVLDVKQQPNGRIIVTTDANMSVFPRPYIYAEHGQHRISVLRGMESIDDNRIKSLICGNALASGDILGTAFTSQIPEVDDLVLFHDAGAYCYSMSSRFSGRIRPAEFLIRDQGIQCIRQCEREECLLDGTGFASRPEELSKDLIAEQIDDQPSTRLQYSTAASEATFVGT